MRESYDPELAPDIETASDNYASRFSGEVGAYFLNKQEQTVLKFLSKISSGQLTILELGGGHCQLTPLLLRAGHKVTVHGSAESCFSRFALLKNSYSDNLNFITSSIFEIPFSANSFDLVISLRLLAHVPRWSEVIREMSRIANQGIIIDYAPLGGFNALYGFLFSLKKSLEGNTRTFLRHRTSELANCFENNGFRIISSEKQFFLPMVIHRKLNKARLSTYLEYGFTVSGLTQLLGSPVIVLAQKKNS